MLFLVGFPVKVLQSIDQQDLKIIVALHIAKAQCLTNVLRHKDGVQVYNDALSVSILSVVIRKNSELYCTAYHRILVYLYLDHKEYPFISSNC